MDYMSTPSIRREVTHEERRPREPPEVCWLFGIERGGGPDGIRRGGPEMRVSRPSGSTATKQLIEEKASTWITLPVPRARPGVFAPILFDVPGIHVLTVDRE